MFGFFVKEIPFVLSNRSGGNEEKRGNSGNSKNVTKQKKWKKIIFMYRNLKVVLTVSSFIRLNLADKVVMDRFKIVKIKFSIRNLK